MSRGPHPDDRRLFAAAQVSLLRRATAEVSWLLGRGYSIATAVAAAGNHHQLEQRQRVAVTRAAAGDLDRDRRRTRVRRAVEAAGQHLSIDGFNLLIALEVALGGGVLVRGREGALRDLAGLRGTYHIVEETGRALDLAGEALAVAPPARVEILLDRAVSNSGRLKQLIEERAAAWPFPCSVELVPDPDPILAARDWIVSGDAVILDGRGPWVNLAGEIVEARVPGAWIVDLSTDV